MIIPILLIVFIGIPTVQGIGNGAAIFIRAGKEYREQGKATRIRGWQGEAYCEPESDEQE